MKKQLITNDIITICAVKPRIRRKKASNFDYGKVLEQITMLGLLLMFIILIAVAILKVSVATYANI